MKHILLKNADAKVVVAPELGGAIVSYQAKINNQLHPIFRQAIEKTSVKDSSCFPLVPFSNRIRNGSFDWLGTKINLPLNQLPEKHTNHGHGWHVVWQIISHTDNRVIIGYEYKADDWPFSYKTEQTITLDGTCLEIQLSLVNCSSVDMPAGLGLHPYFSRTAKASLHCNVSQLWAVDDESMPINIIDAPASIASEAGLVINEHCLDNAFINFPSTAEIKWPEWGIKAELSSSSNCRFMVVYSPENADFFCVEPVTHCTDAINMANNGVPNTGATTIKPNEKMLITMTINPTAL